MQIWQKRETMQIPDSIPAYLKRAVINRSLNQIKARKPLVEDTLLENRESSHVEADAQLAAEDLEQVIQQALDQLPERCRAVFMMRRIEGFSLKEIAELMNISSKTVENQMTKALKALKKAVEPYVKENSS